MGFLFFNNMLLYRSQVLFMKNKKVLEAMIAIFESKKIDWMGFKITKSNYRSYHHIDEKRNGGQESIDNGAILSRDSHKLLHLIEEKYYDLYLQWQLLFIDINNLRKPIDDTTLKRILQLQKETLLFVKSQNIELPFIL